MVILKDTDLILITKVIQQLQNIEVNVRNTYKDC